MNGVRPPVIAGVGGGVGTTSLAVALHGRDAGSAVAGADIVACRARPDSLRRAANALDSTAPGPRPVLAVTLDGARPPRGPVRAHLDQLAGAVSAVVLLPDVGRWRRIVDPLPEAASLLVEPVERVPRPLRAYAAALRDLAAAVAASGRLETPPTATDQPAAPPTRAGRPGAPATTGGRPGTAPALAAGAQAPGTGGAGRPTGLHRAWPEHAGSASRPTGTARVGDTPAGSVPAGHVPAGNVPAGRTPRVVGTFRPVVAPVGSTMDTHTAEPRTRSAATPAAVRVGPRPPDGPDATAVPGGEPRRRRGVRIVGPARPAGPPVSAPAAAPPPGEPARRAAARVVQVG